MKHICAWCKVELPEDDEEPKDMISHGMCAKCEEAELMPADHQELQSQLAVMRKALDRLNKAFIAADEYGWFGPAEISEEGDAAQYQAEEILDTDAGKPVKRDQMMAENFRRAYGGTEAPDVEA